MALCAALLTGIFGPAPVKAEALALPPLPDAVAKAFPAIGRFGRAGFRDRQGCTATLIAPDLVLTAAHCVSETGTSGSVFVAGWMRGDYIAARDAIRETRHPRYGLGGTKGPYNDVALVVLASPITEVTPLPLGAVAAGSLDGTKAALIGYHKRTPHLLSGDFNCPVGRFAPGLLHVGCPVINGNSGAPLLRETGAGGWEIVGVITSQIGAGAIAVELSDWLRDAVAAHGRTLGE